MILIAYVLFARLPARATVLLQELGCFTAIDTAIIRFAPIALATQRFKDFGRGFGMATDAMEGGDANPQGSV